MKTIHFLGKSSVFHMLFLVLLSFVVKGWYLGTTNLGGDECFSAFASQLPINEIVGWLSTGNNPPLWEIILHYWTQLFGTSEIALRTPAYIFNALTVIPIYAIGSRFISKKVGFFAALLFIFSSFSLFMAHEARVYSLATFLCTTSVLIFLSLIRNPSSKKLWISFVLVNALLLYSHYLTAWIIALETLIFVIAPQIRRALRWKFIIHLAVVIVLFVPFIGVVFNRFLDSGISGTWVETVSGYKEFYYMLWHYTNNPYLTRGIMVLIFLGIVFLFWKRVQLKDIFGHSLIIYTFIWVPFTISFLLSYEVGFFLDRYMFLFTPFYYLSIVLSIHHIFYKKPGVTTVLNSAIIILMVTSFSMDSTALKYSNYHQKTRKVVAEINNLQELNTIFLICPKWYDKEIMYYLDREVFNNYRETYKDEVAFKKPLEERGIYPVSHIDEFPKDVSFQRIVYVDHQCAFHCPENNILPYLELHFTKVKTQKVAACMFYTYVRP